MLKRWLGILLSLCLILGAGSTLAQGAGAPAEPVDIVFYNSQFPYTEGTGNPEVIARVQAYIAEQCGVRVNAIIPQKGAEETKLNMTLAAGEKLDLFIQSIGTYKSMGAIQPVGDLVDQYGANIRAAWPEEAWVPLTDNEGVIWALPRQLDNASYPTLIRKDWLNALGLSMPETIDEYEAILKAFKENDPAGSGKTVPLIADLAGLKYGLLGGFVEYGNSNWMDADGSIRPVELAEGFVDWLETAHRWYQEGYLYKETFIVNTDQVVELVTQNQVGCGLTWYSRLIMPLATLRAHVPEADYALAAMTGPKGKVETLNRVGASGYLISARSEHPEAAVQFVDWVFSSYDNYLTSRYGLQGEHWTYVKQDADMVVVDLVPNTGYNGEFAAQGYSSSPMQPVLGSLDPTKKNMYDYIGAEYYNFSRVKMPFDLGVSYDTAALREAVPAYSDLLRMMEEETVKFITGARPIAEYEGFVAELYKIGLQDYINALTAQYQAARQ